MNRQRILITGASAGIGRALAGHYAQVLGAGVVLGLVARRLERLEAAAEAVKKLGAEVHLYVADVREPEPMARVAREFNEAAGGIDVAIANAGISRSDRLEAGEAERGGEVIRTNVVGVINTLLPLIPFMKAQKRGHLVTIGSVAGFRGLPSKGAYCASKAAVKMLMDAYRPTLKVHGIRVTTICPGWVESELTAQNSYRMPFMLPTDRAAGMIFEAIRKGRRTYVFPWQMRLVSMLMPWVPDWMLPKRGSRT